MGLRHLLGRHVAGGPHRVARAGHRSLIRYGVLGRRFGTDFRFFHRLARLQQREPKIKDLDLPLPAEHQVRRLDVAVDQAVLMDVLEPYSRLPHQFAGVGDLERPNAANQLPQVESVDVFHHQHGGAVDAAGVVRLDDVGVREAADGLHFALEAGNGPRVARAAFGQGLQGNDLVEEDLTGPENGSHPALAASLQQFVLPKAAYPPRRTVGGGKRPDAALALLGLRKWQTAVSTGRLGDLDGPMARGRVEIVKRLRRTPQFPQKRVLLTVQFFQRCFALVTRLDVVRHGIPCLSREYA